MCFQQKKKKNCKFQEGTAYNEVHYVVLKQ